MFWNIKKGKPKRKPQKAPRLTKAQLEELEMDFFSNNMEYLQKLEHQIVMKKESEYSSIEAYHSAYVNAILALDELKKFCMLSPGGRKWFSSMYHHVHNSRNPDFNFEQRLREGYKELMENYADHQAQFEHRISEDELLAEHREEIREKLIHIITESPGTLQKNIYMNFPVEHKSIVISVLMEMVKTRTIRREKVGNSFALFTS